MGVTQEETSPAARAEKVEWDLDDLYRSHEDLDRDIKATEELTVAFYETYHGRISELSEKELLSALEDLEKIHDRAGRAYSYAYLTWSTNTEDASRGALLQKVREFYSRVSQRILFFELEWIQVSDENAARIIESTIFSSYRHFLEVQRLMKPFVLTEPEEKVLAEKSVTGRSAWVRYFDELLGAARFDFRDTELTEQEVLAKLHDSDRSVRRDASNSLTAGLRQRLRSLTFAFNTLLADKASDDRMRGYPHWLSARNLANEIADDMVEALIDAVTGRYDLVSRYYTLKRNLLGLDALHDYDRYAPVGAVDREYAWNEARDLVLESYSAFHSDIGGIAEKFFDLNWIDAAVKPGKRGGAFSHGTVPSAHPYILMNYTGKVRDVQTLAHELGHGVHQYLARSQGVFHADTPLTTAETASVFGEMLVFKRLTESERDPASRLAMLAGKIDDSMATVFRQISMNRFEDKVHTARRESGELSHEQLSTFWLETQQAMYGDSVTLTDNYRIWWCYIPHFLHTPGYVYAYAFGELLVLALYALYLQESGGFAETYIELLSAGGSDWPHKLVARMGVDLTDPEFWNNGLNAVESLIAEAEALSQEIS